MSGLADVPLPALAANPACLSINESLLGVFVICRLGNDSQVAADALRSVHADIPIKDVVGGLKAWARDVDETFPVY
jgi:adenylyltransferase/sulfurtransferase